MKLKLKKLDKKTEKVFKESDVAVLLENLTDNIGIIAEGQTALSDRFDGLETRFDGLEKEMKSGFSMVMDYLKRIDEEIVDIKKELKEVKEKKVNWNIYSLLEKRVENAEKQIEEMKALLKEKRIRA